MEEITLAQYLEKKNINWQSLKEKENTLWEELMHTFGQMHTNSFEMRKKFIINKLRLKYPLEVYRS
ncbi:MAG: hypothetical protein SFU27_04500 [Thermonemataceae bacterium]|nr:hypothetical protein [Thermonemataceae bacterium]